jgi:electron transport complex protein RnfG
MTTVANPSYRKRIGYHAGLLGGFVTLATALLMIGNIATREVIAQRQQEDLLASLGQVIPAALHDQDLLGSTLMINESDGTARTVYRAVRERQIGAVAFKAVGGGYAGPIEVLMGIDANGKLLGVRIIAHTETPGLGDKIEAGKDDWIHGFTGRGIGHPPLERWAVRKDGGDFDQFTGATVTPRAVVAVVKDGLLWFASHRAQLLAPLPAAPALAQGEDES